MARWKPAEEKYLEDHAGDGARAIAEALGRTEIGVAVHASRIGVSLRKRWLCPRCNRWTYSPLVGWSGWCRKCSIDESADRAAIRNREIRREVEEEKRKVDEAMRRRQAIYTDTDRKKGELRRLSERRKVNEKSKGEQQ